MPKKNRKTVLNGLSRIKKFMPLYLMMIPGIIYLLVNNYIPMTGIVLAFKKYDMKKGMYGSNNIGLKNFEFLFKTRDAWKITRNTLGYNIVFILLGTVVAISIALILNEIKKESAKKAYQTMILVPYLISIVVVSYIVYGFLNTQSGFINNSILESFGASPISWYSEAKYWPYILVLTHIWKNAGYSCIIYYATLIGIDKGYYEAAVIDGATSWQQIKHISLPGLKNTIVTLTLLAVGRIFYSDFGLFYQVPMSSGALIDVTNTIDTYVYRGLTQQNNIGMAAAAGFYQSMVGFALVLTANYIVRKISKDNALF